jgi:hypothetical protein
VSAEPDRLRDRLVLAALEALTDGDPVLVIGVGDNEVRLGWADEHELPERLTMGETKRLQVERSVDVPLRDRIAAAIRDVDDWRGVTDPAILADAVIAGLGLRKQSQTGEIVNIIEGDDINYGRHRYITDWEPDH